MTASRFDAFVAIDWSGQAVARPKGLAVAFARNGDEPPALLRPAGGWSREAILEFIVAHGKANTNLLIGLDLSPGLPFVDLQAYFPGWDQSPTDARSLWKCIDDLSSETPYLGVNGFLRHAEVRRHLRLQTGAGDLFGQGAGRLRRCEIVQKAMQLSPSSCMNLIGAAQVGKSSMTGMRVLHRLNDSIPVWPFDQVPESGPVIVEIYTSIAARAAGLRTGLSKIREADTLDIALNNLESRPHHRLDRYDDHSTDAILTAAWMRANADRDELWHPPALTQEIAATEGWTFGVT